jgi:hypothetical protein
MDDQPLAPEPHDAQSHWYRKGDEPEPDYADVVSPRQAVGEALAVLGHDAPASELRRHLLDRGIDLSEELIELARRDAS